MKRGIWVLSWMVGCFFMSNSSVFGVFDGYLLRIGDQNEQRVAPYFFGDMDAAGYSDWIWYGPSPIHEHGYHEVLSGEWGAAIYYDGIDTELTVTPDDSSTRRQAMWLTKDFSFADWDTNSKFVFGNTCAAWHDDNNPTPFNNVGRSVIRNDEIEITIDYEVVDVNSLSSTFSPMAYISDPNTGAVNYVLSDQYIFLQTYTIKNLKDETLTDLEFYQFLHSHGANEYAPRVNSTYTDTLISDPLAGYIPYDPIHQVGNFRYDITQWNSPPYGTESTVDHIDYVGFSSTIEPDWIDNDVYDSIHAYAYDKRTYGSHVNIENRSLNAADSIYLAEVGGTMGWSLGSLDPNESTSMTVAFMFAPEQDSPSLKLIKMIEDANDCYSPGQELAYTIEWENVGSEDAVNAVLVDYLPAGVIYPANYTFQDGQMVSSDLSYDDENHIYTWNLGTIPAGSSGSVTLPVTVSELAEPGMTIINHAILETSIGKATAYYRTNVCCWDNSGIIYVDENATGGNSGTSWENAYTDFQKAIARANAGCWTSTEIRVAQGIYDPGRMESAAFKIPDNTNVYGGYKGGSVDGDDRNPDVYVTVLTGDMDAVRNSTVVEMKDNSLLDGFTVTSAAKYGIYGKDADFTIENCIIENSQQFGIYAENGNVGVKWCSVNQNAGRGIYHLGIYNTIKIENCHVSKNQEHGIFSENSTPTIKNCVIDANGSMGEMSYGVLVFWPEDVPVMYNNTILSNLNYGIAFVDNDPNYPDYPDIQNCIIYYNNSSENQFYGLNPDAVAQYCCIQDCNELNTSNFNDEPGFAYTIDPNDMPDPNNFHLSWNSPCKDAGNPNHTADHIGLYDMDAEDRIVNNRVDIGADEIYSCGGNNNDDIYNSMDWNSDGQVNLTEFSKFSAAWLSHDPNDPAWIADPNLADPNLSEVWSPLCNLDDTGYSAYSIDLADLDIFFDDWCWIACWKQSWGNRFETTAAAMSDSTESLMMASSVMSSIAFEPAEISITEEDSDSEYLISELNSIEKTTVQVLAVIDQTIQDEAYLPNIEGIYEIKTFLEDCLTDIRAQK